MCGTPSSENESLLKVKLPYSDIDYDEGEEVENQYYDWPHLFWSGYIVIDGKWI